ncbi:MAG: hypothetical protein AB7I27_01590 [Bacteriovoracaceae bacterium]
MKYLIVLLLSLLTTQSLLALTLRGMLLKKENEFIIRSHSNEELKIIATPFILASLPSLESPSYMSQSNGQHYTFRFKGEIINNEFHLQEVPTLVAGTHVLTGILKYSNGKYSIRKKPVKFGASKIVNGYQFDEISKKSLIGKEIQAEGYLENDTLIIQAATPMNLFSASIPYLPPSKVMTTVFDVGPKDFLLKEIIRDEFSQMRASYRIIVTQNQREEIKPGDYALLITLSGRQGDSFGAVNGHMVAGIAEVQEDLSLDAEVANAYVTNDKDILSGNTALTSYFSHIIQGQNNYRPTYTLIAYGFDKEKLKAFRNALEKSHIELRTKKLSITPQLNCTTESIKALKDVGIEGEYHQIDNNLWGLITNPLNRFGETPETINYVLKNDPSRYQPRPAYESFLKAFLKKSYREKHGIKRVDFVYYSQIPSSRPTGGIALGNVLRALKYKKLYQKYEVDEATKLDPEALRPILEKELKEIQNY